jgi:hypothetical protein
VVTHKAATGPVVVEELDTMAEEEVHKGMLAAAVADHLTLILLICHKQVQLPVEDLITHKLEHHHLAHTMPIM